ncbi:hypothetical protein GCM10011344_09770 [Dokdonia pacifica]|uniref:DUF4252 domain-containing protein n=1 Tax=Dokdonia pacifica TaxID=1627892 RepID=A0A238YP34_9FLAO|nr:DUF4252 domain-containing protein [Dokdonia pacifica]GGG11108.1 hypothetical protein GCM10011344_09770 [Dokdonia pacifica]SNR72568.1 protein of unknown function [Dokdonia pacifica]
MKGIVKIIAIVLFAGITLTSCNNGETLQEYYVANQDNTNFILVDVPTSLISKDSEALDAKQKEVLETVRKINIMAYPLKDGTTATFDSEVAKVSTILASDDYEELMKVNSDMGNMKLYFRGEEDAIDEVIVFASEDSKGFVLARLLGNDMNIADMANLAKTIQAGDIDVSQFDGVMDVFNQQ